MKSKKIFELLAVLSIALCIFLFFAFVQSRKHFRFAAKQHQSTLEIYNLSEMIHSPFISPTSSGQIYLSENFLKYRLFKVVRLYKQSLDWMIWANPSRKKLDEIEQKYHQNPNLISISIMAEKEKKSAIVGSRWLNKNESTSSKNTLYAIPVLTVWNFILIVSFFGWILGVFLFITCHFDENGKIVRKNKILVSIFSLAGLFILWLFSLTKI